MEEIDFEPAPASELSELTQLEIIEPDLVMPSSFDRRAASLRAGVAMVLRHAEMVLASEMITAEDQQRAIEAGQLLQATTKAVAEFYKPVKQRIDQIKQPILDAERSETESLKSAKDRLGAAILEFDRRQQEAQQLAQELARDRAQDDGMTIEGELPLPVIVPIQAPGKTRGKVPRATWRAEVTDFMKLVQAVAAGHVLPKALLPNGSWLDKRADTDREGMSIPGVEARETKKVHFRT